MHQISNFTNGMDIKPKIFNVRKELKVLFSRLYTWFPGKYFVSETAKSRVY